MPEPLPRQMQSSRIVQKRKLVEREVNDEAEVLELDKE